MKIIHLIDNLGFGGAQTLLKGIFENQNSNQDIYLYSLRNKKDNIIVNHKNVYIDKSKSKSKYSINQIFEVKKEIFNNKIDVIHCHLFKAFIFGIILKLFFFKNIRLVFHEHGRIIASDNNNVIEDFIYILFLKIFKNKVDFFISVSNYIKDILINKINIKKNKIVVLYNYVDLNKFKKKNYNNKKNNLKINRAKNDFIVGFAGRIVQRKGWKEYIEAAKILYKNYSDLKFLIAGNGFQLNKLLRAINKNNLLNRVLYLGYIEEIKEFYSFLDCFVLPSHWEGLPMTQLEVMAYGIPLITCDGPGMNEIPLNNFSALFCMVKDPNDLADKIIKIYKGKSLRNKLISNSKKIIKKYSLRIYLTNLERIYKNLLIG